MSDTPTFDRWWNETGSNEYEVSDHHTLREGWRACITHRAVPLQRELSAAQAESRKLALHTAEQATELGKLRSQLATAESECAIRNDEVSGLQGMLSEAQARISELEKENADQRHDIGRLLESLNAEINAGKP